MNLERKIEELTRRLEQAPHSRVFAPLADLLRQTGRLDEALELLDDGLDRHPEYLSALVIKGRTLLDAGDVDPARQVLARVLVQDPENVVVLRLLTEDARSRQAWNEAVPLLEKLVVLDPDEPKWLEVLAETRRFAEGEKSDEAMDSSFATMTLVDIYLAQGYRDKALAALSRMAESEPGRADVMQRIAEIQDRGLRLPESVGKGESGQPGNAGPDSRRASRRSTEKKQFEEWIDRLRQDGGSSP